MATGGQGRGGGYGDDEENGYHLRVSPPFLGFLGGKKRVSWGGISGGVYGACVSPLVAVSRTAALPGKSFPAFLACVQGGGAEC